MKRKKIKKLLFSTAVLVEILALNIYPALAFSIPSATSVASDIEKRYHLNTGTLRDMGESLNTMNNKDQSPQVTLSFDPADPQLGEKIKATASPLYFTNDPGMLYYTWYLKHENNDNIKQRYDPALKKNISCDGDGNCDHNGDGKINVQDWKIEAARIMANGSFDFNKALGRDSPNCSGSASAPDYCSQDNKYETAADDKDGYEAIPGGDDKKDMPPHCYIHDFVSGTDYELVEGQSGSTAFCQDLGDGITREAICARTVDDISSDLSSATSICKSTTDEPICSISSLTLAEFSCPSDDEIPLCVDPENIATNGTIFNSLSQTDSCENIDTDSINFPKGLNQFLDDISCGSETATLNDDVVFLCDDEDTRHLFPYVPSQSPSDSGDNSFDRNEELFWHTNPESADTDGNGKNDEASVIGLGQITFAWNYEPGDKIGVAVEGISTAATKYDDSSMQIMWALLKNNCEVGGKGSYTKRIKGYNVKLPIASVDSKGQDSCIAGNCLNNCLSDNLVDPRGDANSLEISLSYTPENPLNDSSGSNSGDELVVSASVLNAANSNFLKYQWEVYKGDSVNPASWGDPLLKSELPDATQTSGIGLSTFKFKLNLAGLVPKYLKVRAVVTENVDSTTKNSGSSDIVIPITSVASKINVYSTSANDDLSLKLLTGKKRCDTGMENVVCPVVKNEIVGMKVDGGSGLGGEALTNILWTIDGEPIEHMSCGSETACSSGSTDCDCDPKTGEGVSIAYFPVLKDNGEQYSIGLTADSSLSLGKKINVTKTFEIVDPHVSISSNDKTTCAPEYLGSYVDLDGKPWPDYSDTSFVALTEKAILLKPVLNMPFIQNPQWFIDGAEAASQGATVKSDGSLQFTAKKPAGETYSVTYSGIYAQNQNIKKMLNSSYGVQLDEFYEKPIGASIEITMTDSFSGTSVSQNGTGRKILASLAADVPAYIIFLFRIALTAGLLLFTSSVLISFSGKTNEE